MSGDSWAHAATSRIILLWRGKRRFAYLYKSPYMPAAEAEYVVTSAGVRSVRPAAGGGCVGAKEGLPV